MTEFGGMFFWWVLRKPDIEKWLVSLVKPRIVGNYVRVNGSSND